MEVLVGGTSEVRIWAKFHVMAEDALCQPNSEGTRALSNAFPLGRGTRQGCPLSPGLFALVVEPLAIALRAETGVRGIVVGEIEEKVSLYADDTLLYLADASQ